jgi:uncharacterized membrane protein SirB2
LNALTPDPPRGRIPPRENAAPPLWVGLSAALVGVGLLAAGLSGPEDMSGFGAIAFTGAGLLFGAIGIALSLTTLRETRTRYPAHLAGENTGLDRFTRSPMRILVDLVLAPLGGIGFIALAVLIPRTGDPMTWLFSLLSGLFAFIMLSTAAVTMRRGWRRTVAEVDPDGIWTPELPRRLAWDEIDHLEAEAARGAAGSAGTATYRRLGIWPRDPELAARAPGRRIGSVIGSFAALANRVAPGAGISDPAAMAPFGIWAFELEQDFAELLRSVRRYAPIVGVPDASGSLETVQGVPIPPADLPDGLAAAILEGLAGASVSPAPLGGLVAGVPPTVSDATPAVDNDPGVEGTSWTFVRRPGVDAVRDAMAEASMSLFMSVFAVFWISLHLLPGMDIRAHVVMLFGDVVAIVFLGFGIGGLLELPGRWRMRRGDPALVTVDERGIEMRGMGRLAWSQVAIVRVAGSSIPTQEGTPAIRRLEIYPLDPTRLRDRLWSDRAYDRFRAVTGRLAPFGRRRRAVGAFAIDLDVLQDPEQLLDAIAHYRVVDES